MPRPAFAYAPAFLLLVAAAPEGPLQLTSRVLVERAATAADGTTRIALVAPTRVVPGDRVTVELAYRNTGRQPLADLVLVNRVPAGMAYRGVAPAAAAPELSVDGTAYAPLATLHVGTRAATADDVTHVRWRLARPLAPGAAGTLAFRTVLK